MAAQPQPVYQPMPAAGQPVQATVAYAPADMRRHETPWNTGLCDCTQDGSSCAETMFCHYCQLGYQYNQLMYPQQNPKSMHVGMCFGACCADSCTGLGTPVGAVMIRMDVRQKLGIEGDVVNDIFMGGCCSACSTCQVYREMSIRGAWPGSICADGPPANLTPNVQVMGGQPQQQPQHVQGGAYQAQPVQYQQQPVQQQQQPVKEQPPGIYQ